MEEFSSAFLLGGGTLCQDFNTTDPKFLQVNQSVTLKLKLFILSNHVVGTTLILGTDQYYYGIYPKPEDISNNDHLPPRNPRPS